MSTPDVVSITSKLIGLDSQSHVSNVTIADYIAELIRPVATEMECIEYVDGCGVNKVSLVVRLGEGEEGLALSAHMDTVPGLDWPYDPFEAKSEGGRLFGLGACDMKGPLACTLAAAFAYQDLGAKRPLTLLYSADEETDTEGARRIAHDSKILATVRPKYCVIVEPTDLRVVNAHKGAVTFNATTKGRAAHSSTGEGTNANIKMIPFLHEMWQLHQELIAQDEYHDDDFEPPYPDWNIVIDNFDTAPNVTVPKSSCTINFRYSQRLDPEPIIRRVESSARSNDVDLSYWSSGAPLLTPPDSTLVQLALETTGEDRAVSVPYRTDACVLSPALQCIVLGPGSHLQAHTVGEWVSIKQLYKAVKSYEYLIRQVCS